MWLSLHVAACDATSSGPATQLFASNSDNALEAAGASRCMFPCVSLTAAMCSISP